MKFRRYRKTMMKPFLEQWKLVKHFCLRVIGWVIFIFGKSFFRWKIIGAHNLERQAQYVRLASWLIWHGNERKKRKRKDDYNSRAHGVKYGLEIIDRN